MPVQIETWESITKMVNDITTKIVKDHTFMPEVIVAVTRGGWIPAAMLSHRLTPTLLVSTLEPDHELPRHINPICNVLIVDAVCDTGETLKEMMKYMLPNARTVVLIWKRDNTKFVPNYYAATTKDWVKFPWEEE